MNVTHIISAVTSFLIFLVICFLPIQEGSLPWVVSISYYVATLCLLESFVGKATPLSIIGSMIVGQIAAEVFVRVQTCYFSMYCLLPFVLSLLMMLLAVTYFKKKDSTTLILTIVILLLLNTGGLDIWEHIASHRID